MAFTTYAGLIAEVPLWLRRSDLTDAIPGFIALAEGEMNRRLRVRRMIERSTATISDEYSAVPSDFLGVRSFVLDGDELRYLTLDQMDVQVMITGSGAPTHYAIDGGEFRYYPAPAESYTATLNYWQEIPALSVSNTSNWVLLKHPDAYLQGVLKQAAIYLRSDERLAVSGPLFEAALTAINAADASESQGAILTPLPSTAWAGYI